MQRGEQAACHNSGIKKTRRERWRYCDIESRLLHISEAKKVKTIRILRGQEEQREQINDTLKQVDGNKEPDEILRIRR